MSVRFVRLDGAKITADGCELVFEGDDGKGYKLDCPHEVMRDLLRTFQGTFLSPGADGASITLTVRAVRPAGSGLGPVLVLDTEEVGTLALRVPGQTRADLRAALDGLGPEPVMN